MTIFPAKIRVEFSEFGPHVPYAANLAELLGVPLSLCIPTPEHFIGQAALLQRSNPLILRLLIRERAALVAQKFLGSPLRIPVHTTTVTSAPDAHDIVVSSCTKEHAVAPVLSPAGEHTVFRTKHGGIFVPFGDGPSGVIGATYGAVLAKRLSTNVILWHTTWRNSTVTSADPKDHLIESAKAVMEQSQQILHEAGVPFTTHCECKPRLVEGLIGSALYLGASLIVMAQGAHKEFGTYTDRVRARNCPIPVLIIPKEAA